MIARHWRGWTEARNADAYETLLKTRVLPDLKRVPGYRGGYILRSDGKEEVEFVVVNLFESIEAVRFFAGAEYSTPVFVVQSPPFGRPAIVLVAVAEPRSPANE